MIPDILHRATFLLQAGAAVGREAPQHQPNFQPYIFWAYGLACALLFIFTLWTLRQTKQLARRTEYLKERFLRAHPGALEDEP